MKKYSKLIAAAFFAVVFVGTFVFLYLKSQPEPVTYAEVKPVVGDISLTTIVTGKIEPRNEVNIKPQISGIITDIYKEAGAFVKAPASLNRSEERRVGKECRSRWSPYH